MSSMTADQAERLALEIRGIADSILCAREMIHISDRDIENSISILFAAELHLNRIAAELET